MKIKSYLIKLLFLSVLVFLLASFRTSDNVSPVDYASTFIVSDSIDPNEFFYKIMAVITHKRCMNCHPADDTPKQGEDSHPHYFNIKRGPENHGAAVLQCSTCHQEENNFYSGVPGAPHWGLAPESMGWEGLNRVEIARAMLNPDKNGDRNLEEIVKHLIEDQLVLWAWEPGIKANGKLREIPPVSKEEFIQAVKGWAAAGAPIPSQ